MCLVEQHEGWPGGFGGPDYARVGTCIAHQSVQHLCGREQQISWTVAERSLSYRQTVRTCFVLAVGTGAGQGFDLSIAILIEPDKITVAPRTREVGTDP